MERAQSSASDRTASEAWWRGGEIPCPPLLRERLERAIGDRHYRDGRFLLVLGLVLAVASLVVDAIAIPEHLALVTLIRLLPVVSLQAAALAMPRERLGWQKALLAASLIVFALSLLYPSSLAPSPADAFMAMGVAFLLGMATPLLPLRGAEMLAFVTTFVAASAALALYLFRDPAFGQAFLPILLIVALGAAVLSRRLQWLERRSALLTLQAEERARQLEQSNARLTELSMQDPLTNLANRRWAEIAFERDYAMTGEEAPGHTGLLLLDLDHFKAFNDRWGHDAGDTCLQAVAEVMRHAAGQHGGIAARFGGEEFVVVARFRQIADAIALAEDLRVGVERIEMDCGEPNAPVTCTTSIGIAVHEGPGKAALSNLLKRADKALYEAKRAGRNRHRLAD